MGYLKISKCRQYAKYKWSDGKVYLAVLDILVASVRLSRKKFMSATKAVEYRRRVLGRLNKMREGASAPPELGAGGRQLQEL